MKHKKLLISLALLIVVLLALTITCPKADDHREAIRSEVASAMSQSLQSNDADAFHHSFNPSSCLLQSI